MFTYFESISPASHPPARQPYHPSPHPTARPPARPSSRPPTARSPPCQPQYNPQISLKAFKSIHFTQDMWYSSLAHRKDRLLGNGRPTPFLQPNLQICTPRAMM